MSIQIMHDHFETRDEACAHINESGLHFTEFDVPAVENDAHWHRFDAELYVVKGTLFLTDVERDIVLEVTEGTKAVVPEGTLHAEKSDGYTVLLGSSIPPSEFDDPVNLPPR